MCGAGAVALDVGSPRLVDSEFVTPGVIVAAALVSLEVMTVVIATAIARWAAGFVHRVAVRRDGAPCHQRFFETPVVGSSVERRRGARKH